MIGIWKRIDANVDSRFGIFEINLSFNLTLVSVKFLKTLKRVI